MVHRSWMTLALAVAPLMAGGFFVEFGNPSAAADARAKDALVTVRAVGCHEPAKAQVTAVAEGMVNGKRETVPLNVIALDSPGLHAIKGEVPKAGKWVISVHGVNGDLVTSAIVPVVNGNVERNAAKLFAGRRVNSSDLRQMLD